MRSRTLLVGAAAIIGIGVAKLAARRTMLRWGATTDELAATLPGDELLPAAGLVATRAITIAAGRADVWPWLAQMGQGRGGLYSYDLLENLVANCNIHSADRVVPDWQDVAPGDEVKLHPDVALTVAAAHPGSALVLRGGVPLADAPAPYDFVWAFVLRDGPDGSTRLVVRERYSWSQPWVRAMVEVIEVVSFVMTEKMLRGIRDRAEHPVGAPC